MKFVLTNDYTFNWPVEVKMPDPDKAGETISYEFEGVFRLQLKDEAERADAELAALPPAERDLRKHDMIKDILKGWDENVVGADKKTPVPFSAAALGEAMRNPFFTGAVYRAYAEALAGGARRGN